MEKREGEEKDKNKKEKKGGNKEKLIQITKRKEKKR